MEQRTAMLNGVSHDLRTILTRFKLQLALAGDNPDLEGLDKDVDDMQSMLKPISPLLVTTRRKTLSAGTRTASEKTAKRFRDGRQDDAV